MITGYNTDVRHGNRVFHIQTEDKGLSNPKIETLIYVGGEILDSYRSSYEDLLYAPPVVDAVVQLRFVETDNEVNRQIFIVKSRGSAHSNRRQSYVITDRGIEFPNPPLQPPVLPGNGERKGGR